jgi:hypothetical protein
MVILPREPFVLMVPTITILAPSIFPIYAATDIGISSKMSDFMPHM